MRDSRQIQRSTRYLAAVLFVFMCSVIFSILFIDWGTAVRNEALAPFWLKIMDRSLTPIVLSVILIAYAATLSILVIRGRYLLSLVLFLAGAISGHFMAMIFRPSGAHSEPDLAGAFALVIMATITLYFPIVAVTAISTLLIRRYKRGGSN